MKNYLIYLFLICIILAVSITSYSYPTKESGPYDAVTGAMTTVSHEIEAIHNGCAYRAGLFTSLANGASTTLIIHTNSHNIHYDASVSSQYLAHVEFFEGVATYSGGVEITPMNPNRESSCVSHIKVFRNAAIDYTGTTALGSQGIVNGRNEGSTVDSNKFLLASETVYVIRITNDYNNDNVVTLRANWDEHIHDYN